MVKDENKKAIKVVEEWLKNTQKDPFYFSDIYEDTNLKYKEIVEAVNELEEDGIVVSKRCADKLKEEE